MPSARQIIGSLNSTIRRLIKQGKTDQQILNSPEVKRHQNAYNTTGFIYNDYQLKRTIKRLRSIKSGSRSKGRLRINRSKKRSR